MEKIAFLFRYIRYLFTAKGLHGTHSPFVYHLYEDVIADKRTYYAYEEIESLRASLLLSNESIEVTDLGAGSISGLSNKRKRKIKNIALSSAKQPKYGQLLFRLVNHFKPETIIELGTSLGLSSLYLAKANSNTKLVTLEGCEQTADVAKRNFRKLKVENIELIQGNFNQTLNEALQKTGKADFVFFDGNHRKSPTLSYFNDCLPFITNESVFIFDDIHWSAEMEDAWKEIQLHPRVKVTIDLFAFGLVFFRREQAKEDFVMRY